MLSQKRSQRITLLSVLGYEGLGALVGGALLVVRPDGAYMDMPVGIMHGTFQDFLFPGLILFGLGVLNVTAFFSVLRRQFTDWLWAGLAIFGLAIWFTVEIIILRELHWLHVMWGFPVIAGLAAAAPLIPFRPETRRDVWLVCGALSSLLYLAMTIVLPRGWPGYASASQTISELSAVGAPTRPVWVVLGLFYTVLVVTFGWGVRMAAGANRNLRIAGTLIALYGALGLIWPFAPMHQRAVLAAGGGTAGDTLHLVLGAATEIIYLLALGFAAVALGTAFRLYSVATFVFVLVFGALMFREMPGVGANQPTPLLGVWERINIGVFLLWMIVLAIVLLVRGHAQERRAPLEALAQPA
jgi:hypothetical protein